jgi:hypothetical protein
MQDQNKQVRGSDDRRVEQVIVLQILRDDHDERWSRAELEVELDHIDALAINDALARLEAEGVVQLSGEAVSASRAIRCLDDLELISIDSASRDAPRSCSTPRRGTNVRGPAGCCDPAGWAVGRVRCHSCPPWVGRRARNSLAVCARSRSLITMSAHSLPSCPSREPAGLPVVERYVSRAELASIMGVSLATVDRMVAEGCRRSRGAGVRGGSGRRWRSHGRLSGGERRERHEAAVRALARAGV